MQSHRTATRTIRLTLALLAIALGNRVIAAESPTADDSTPQKTFIAFRTAVQQKEWDTAYAHLGPKSQQFLFLSLSRIAMNVAKDSPRHHDKIDDLFLKHGIDVEKIIQQVRQEKGKTADQAISITSVAVKVWDTVEDRPTYFAALSKLFLKSKLGNGIPTMDIVEARLEDLELSEEGTQADGVAVTGEGEKEIGLPLTFVLVDDQWRLELP